MTDFGSSRPQETLLAETSSSSTKNKEPSLSTVGQLMRSTAQSIQHLYRDRLEHTPSRVTCDLIDDKLLVWAEDSVTRPEQVLKDLNSSQLSAVSLSIKQNLRDALVSIVEHHLKVSVVTLLSDICYEQNCTAMVVLLAEPPRVRSSRTRR